MPLTKPNMFRTPTFRLPTHLEIPQIHSNASTKISIPALLVVTKLVNILYRRSNKEVYIKIVSQELYIYSIRLDIKSNSKAKNVIQGII